MKEFSAVNYITIQREQEMLFANLIKHLISYKSKEYDSKVNRHLLKKLIFNYSRAEKELYSLNQEKNRFLGMAAHDLRNPLAVIIGLSDIMQMDKEKLSPEHGELTRIINDASKKMLVILNDLLDISAIESGKFKVEKKLQSLESLLRDKVRLGSFIARKKGIDIIEEYCENDDISFDADRIGQVIDNLISNAIKFSFPSSKIIVKLEKLESAYRVFVIDKGVGIPDSEQEKLFVEFSNLTVRPTAGEKCTGLGLAICKKILEAHGSKVEFKSKVGVGSTFGFVLSSL